MPIHDYIELFSAILVADTFAVETRVCAANFEFDQFRAFTDLHHLTGYLYLQIKGSPLEALFPPEYLENLAERYALQRQRSIDILREATNILDAFNTAHRSVLFLKDPFVAKQFYGDVCQRNYMDIDILVSSDDLLATDQLLRDIGFSKRSLVFISNHAMSRFIHAYEYRERIEEPAWP